MYEAYWQLERKPFGSGCDTGFYYPGEAHQGTLLKLRYAVESRHGAALVTGHSGTGKSLVARLLAERVAAEVTRPARSWCAWALVRAPKCKPNASFPVTRNAHSTSASYSSCEMRASASSSLCRSNLATVRNSSSATPATPTPSTSARARRIERATSSTFYIGRTRDG